MKSRLYKIYINLEEIIGASLLVLMCIVAAMQVASRYILNDQFSWTEETCTFLFVWLVFIGSSLALKTNDHFAVDILVEKLPSKFSYLLKIISLILVLSFAGILIVFGFNMTLKGFNSITPALEIPKSIPYAAVPIGGVLMILRTVESGIKLLNSKKT